MKLSKLWLTGMLAMLPALLWVVGCSGNETVGVVGQQPDSSGDKMSPPIHVNTTRGGVYYTPAQISHCYGFDQVAGTGAGQTIAIVDAYGSPTIQNDLNTFCSKYNLPTTTITIAYPSGKPFFTDSGWALETALDVEWAHAMAPGAKILLVVTTSNSTSSLLRGVDYASSRAAQVSMSWGGAEFAGESTQDSHFTVPGVTFFAASGDSGAGAEWPAVSPYVVGVGGTSLSLDSAGNRLAEVAWSGSGGGQSRYVREPSFQTAWQSSGYRQVPDVSYVADPNTGLIVYDGTPYNRATGWFKVGGTSAGTPQWAALMARVNANRTAKISSADTALYAFGNPTTYTTNYFDILTGSNGRYSSGTGYDEVTGIGSPTANALIPGLSTY